MALENLREVLTSGEWLQKIFREVLTSGEWPRKISEALTNGEWPPKIWQALTIGEWPPKKSDPLTFCDNPSARLQQYTINMVLRLPLNPPTFAGRNSEREKNLKEKKN